MLSGDWIGGNTTCKTGKILFHITKNNCKQVSWEIKSYIKPLLFCLRIKNHWVFNRDLQYIPGLTCEFTWLQLWGEWSSTDIREYIVSFALAFK